MNNKKVIVIGAGAIGLSSAYFLQAAGHKVTVIDNSFPTENCSVGNAGMIVPSHFIPLASPGVVWQGIKWIFNPESPFSIKPSVNFELYRWLSRFYRASTHRHVKNSMELLYGLNAASKKLFEEMGHQLGFNLKSSGLLILANSNKGLKHEIETLKLAQKLNMNADFTSVSEIQTLLENPYLKIKGGVYFKEDALIHPGIFIEKIFRYLSHNQVDIKKDVLVTGFKTKGNRITAIETKNGDFKADEFILATGAGSNKLLQLLRLKLPLIAGKGYSLTIPEPKKKITIPCILSEGKVAISPFDNSLRFAGTMEIGASNLQVNKKRVNGLIKSVTNYFSNYGADDFSNLPVWAGLRPVSFDGIPFIGRFNSFRNLIAATGHSMMGISLAPVTGEIVEKLVSGRKSGFNTTLMDPNR